MGLFREQVGRLFRGGTPGLQPATMPTSAPAATPQLDPHEVPKSTPPLTPKRSLRLIRASESQRLFPIRDSEGMIIGLSPKPVPRELGVNDHAELFFEWLSTHGEYAGSPVLARLLPQVYVAFCSEHGLEPFPWRSIATVLKGFTGGKKYTWVREGKRRRRRRVYRIPDRPAEEVYYCLTVKNAAA